MIRFTMQHGCIRFAWHYVHYLVHLIPVRIDGNVYNVSKVSSPYTRCDFLENCVVDVRLHCASLQWQRLFVYAEHIISLKCENRLRGRQHVHDLVMNERLSRMNAAAIGNAREWCTTTEVHAQMPLLTQGGFRDICVDCNLWVNVCGCCFHFGVVIDGITEGGAQNQKKLQSIESVCHSLLFNFQNQRETMHLKASNDTLKLSMKNLYFICSMWNYNFTISYVKFRWIGTSGGGCVAENIIALCWSRWFFG